MVSAVHPRLVRISPDGYNNIGPRMNILCLARGGRTRTSKTWHCFHGAGKVERSKPTKMDEFAAR
jgi:hypothetical protein